MGKIVHIRNWDKLNKIGQLHEFRITDAFVSRTPSAEVMLGLKANPSEIYKLSLSTFTKNSLMDVKELEVIVFPMADNMQVGIANKRMPCQLLTPILPKYLKTPDSFLRFLRKLIDDSIGLIL
jgi:hypothetical protein